MIRAGARHPNHRNETKRNETKRNETKRMMVIRLLMVLVLLLPTFADLSTSEALSLTRARGGKPPVGATWNETAGEYQPDTSRSSSSSSASLPPPRVALLYHGAYHRYVPTAHPESYGGSKQPKMICSNFFAGAADNHDRTLRRPLLTLQQLGASMVLSTYFHTYRSPCRARDDALVRRLHPARIGVLVVRGIWLGCRAWWRSIRRRAALLCA